MKASFLALLPLLLCPLVASALPARQDPYTGLLPKDAKIESSATVPDLAQLKTSTLAIVASQNLEAMVKQHVDYYERGGKERQRMLTGALAAVTGVMTGGATLVGAQIGNNAADQAEPTTRMAIDPRNFTDRVVAALTPYFGTVVTATDLADAFDHGANYVAIVDYYGAQSHWVPVYEASGGVYILDANLKSAVVAEGHTKHKVEGMGLLDSISAMMQGMQDAAAKGMNIPFEQISKTLHDKLGDPLPPPAAAQTTFAAAPAQASGEASASAPSAPSAVDRLHVVEDALKQGLITPEEAESKRQEILQSM